MSITTQRVHEFLERYAGTLTDLDARAAADLWSTPGMIIDEQVSGVLESREHMVEGMEQSYPIYRKLGLSSVGYELLREQQLSDALVLVNVRWLFLGVAGDELTDTTSYYLLRAERSRLRACVCIETDAAAKLQALAAARGVDLQSAVD
ncbi:MAG: hypothetical protein ACQEW8_12455 [Actinomycetota bacterium]